MTATLIAEPHIASFESVEHLAGNPACPLLFLCDHASNALPPEYGTLGLPAAELKRHIAWDIGAADVTRSLAAHFAAPASLTAFSRLLIDPNRGGHDPTLVMPLSHGAIIPGNRHLDVAEIGNRRSRFWKPYRDAVSQHIDRTLASGIVPAIVSIHSFTHIWRGRMRPWQIGLLWDSDPRLAKLLYEELTRDGELRVGDNEPYDGALTGDTMYEHGTCRGLAHVLIEVRQDLIDSPGGGAEWAGRLAGPLASALAGDDIHVVRHFPSRAGSGNRQSLT